jgi:hypothetical protein
MVTVLGKSGNDNEDRPLAEVLDNIIKDGGELASSSSPRQPEDHRPSTITVLRTPSRLTSHHIAQASHSRRRQSDPHSEASSTKRVRVSHSPPNTAPAICEDNQPDAAEPHKVVADHEDQDESKAAIDHSTLDDVDGAGQSDADEDSRADKGSSIEVRGIVEAESVAHASIGGQHTIDDQQVTGDGQAGTDDDTGGGYEAKDDLVPADKGDVSRDRAVDGVERADDAVENEDTIVVEPRQSSASISAPKSPKKLRKLASKSPARSSAEIVDDREEMDDIKVYMAGTTSIDQGQKKIMRTFYELGGSTTKSIVEADVLCVGKNKPLTKSGSLLLTIAHGKPVVTEDWIVDATRLRKFPDPARYLPQDPIREKEWDFNLAEAVERGQAGLTHLFDGKTVYLTHAYQTAVTSKVPQEFSRLAMALGADDVKRESPSKNSIKAAKNANERRQLVIIGVGGDPAIAGLVNKNFKIYSKELLTAAALRGKVEYRAFTLASGVKDEDK